MAMLDIPKQLNGIMGDFYQFSLGAAVTGNGTLTLAKGFYILKGRTIATTTLPKKVGTTGRDIGAGDMFYSDGTLVASATDSYYPIIIINRTDISSWSLSGKADSGKATTFADVRASNIQRELSGMVTLSGSMTGVNTVLMSDNAGWSLNSFFPIITLDGKESATLNPADNSVKYGIFVTNKDTNNKTVPLAFCVAPFQFTGTSISGDPTKADGTAIGGDFSIAADSRVGFNYVVAHNTDSLEVLRLAV